MGACKLARTPSDEIAITPRFSSTCLPRTIRGSDVLITDLDREPLEGRGVLPHQFATQLNVPCGARACGLHGDPMGQIWDVRRKDKDRHAFDLTEFSWLRRLAIAETDIPLWFRFETGWLRQYCRVEYRPSLLPDYGTAHRPPQVYVAFGGRARQCPTAPAALTFAYTEYVLAPTARLGPGGSDDPHRAQALVGLKLPRTLGRRAATDRVCRDAAAAQKSSPSSR